MAERQQRAVSLHQNPLVVTPKRMSSTLASVAAPGADAGQLAHASFETPSADSPATPTKEMGKSLRPRASHCISTVCTVDQLVLFLL